jgi:cyclic beta-1,2-glucan synthetase
MYQFLIESFLGIAREGEELKFKPCIPVNWEEFSVDYKYFDTTYHIKFVQKNTQGISTISMDNKAIVDGTIKLENDGKEHSIAIEQYRS